MKIKQIKNILLALTVLASSIAGSVLVSDTSFAYKCPAGEEYHASDNACWKVESTKQVTEQRTGGFNCNGTLSNVNGNSATCTKYARTNNAPTNDDGSAATLSCPAGQEYHASDNKCWTADSKTVTKQRTGGFTCNGTLSNVNGDTATCTKYTEGANPAIDSANPNNPNANLNYCDKTYVSSGLDNQTANRQACIAGQQGKDCAATYAAASQASQKAACEAGAKNPSATPPINGIPSNGSTSTGDAGTCGNAKTNIITCDGEGVSALADVLKIVLFVLTIIIGIVATGGIVYGAILYASAQDNSGQVSQAKTIIRDVAIGLLLYGFMVAIVNWLIPGGVIS